MHYIWYANRFDKPTLTFTSYKFYYKLNYVVIKREKSPVANRTQFVSIIFSKKPV